MPVPQDLPTFQGGLLEQFAIKKAPLKGARNFVAGGYFTSNVILAFTL
jgi:hypothetical protein